MKCKYTPNRCKYSKSGRLRLCLIWNNTTPWGDWAGWAPGSRTLRISCKCKVHYKSTRTYIYIYTYSSTCYHLANILVRKYGTGYLASADCVVLCRKCFNSIEQSIFIGRVGRTWQLPPPDYDHQEYTLVVFWAYWSSYLRLWVE